MIFEAAKDLEIDLAASILVGDKQTDIQAGLRAGVGHNFLYQPVGLSQWPFHDQLVVSDLKVISNFIARL
jgi:D-glycero-D-manno-heptose 1,7-bisphosphate phosphatase